MGRGDAVTVAEMTCAACGTGLPPNSKFCNECGAAVSPGDETG